MWNANPDCAYWVCDLYHADAASPAAIGTIRLNLLETLDRNEGN
jgi:hypothetical protein